MLNTTLKRSLNLSSSYRYYSTAKPVSSISSQLQKVSKDAKLNLSSEELIKKPELWKGLPIDVVIKLFRSRVISMGKNYKRSEIELKQLLECSKNPLETQLIYNIYNSTEGDIFNADSDETDYDQYVGEGMYMEDPLEPYGFDEYPTSAQDIVRDFRDLMEFNRKAAFELPQLVKFRKPYEPKLNDCISFKFTKFIGESHPGENKVVLSFKLSDLKLKEEEEHKFKLVAGSRYDFKTDIFSMSSGKFNEQAQNESYLKSVLIDLFKIVKNKEINMSDVPLDKRHTIAKYSKKQRKLKQYIPFPKEWEKPIKQDSRVVKLENVLN